MSGRFCQGCGRPMAGDAYPWPQICDLCREDAVAEAEYRRYRELRDSGATISEAEAEAGIL